VSTGAADTAMRQEHYARQAWLGLNSAVRICVNNKSMKPF